MITIAMGLLIQQSQFSNQSRSVWVVAFAFSVISCVFPLAKRFGYAIHLMHLGHRRNHYGSAFCVLCHSKMSLSCPDVNIFVLCATFSERTKKTKNKRKKINNRSCPHHAATPPVWDLLQLWQVASLRSANLLIMNSYTKFHTPM